MIMAKAAKKKSTSKKKASKAATTEVPVKTGGAESSALARTLTPFEDLEKLFDNFLQRTQLRPFGMDWPKWGEFAGLMEANKPSIDIVDRAKEVVVRAEVPGIDKEDLDVSITDRTLTIKGSSRKEEKREEDDYFHHEIRSGSFSRSVLLPTDVDGAKAKAKFKDGVVELHLPKVRASKRQKIEMS
jgi:HSP20 family protein